MDFSKNWIIAEIGSVHDGSFGNALKLIEAAAGAGANCVKFQTHIAEAETLASAPSPAYFTSEGRFDYFQRTAFLLDQWGALADKAAELGVGFMSSPFSNEAVDLLESVDVGAYKIPSGEVTNLPMLEYIATKRKPVILSSGMSTWVELEKAVAALSGAKAICLMQCTSAYPCPPEKVGLNNLAEIKTRFPGLSVGYSDHTNGFAASVSAAAFGATLIEKHFTFSRLMYGSDAANSMEPIEFERFCDAVREAWSIRSNPVDKDQLAHSEMAQMRTTFQKSIVAARDMSAGTIICAEDLRFKKPGKGISAAKWRDVMGRTLTTSVLKDHVFGTGDFE